MIRAFTGPSQLTQQQKAWVARRILVEPVADTWRSGCALGVDTVAAYLAFAVDADLELYIPFAAHNDTLVRQLAPYAKVIRCTKRSTTAASYRKRNEVMVGGSSHLLAFLKKPDFYRSGEWMTINIARNLGIPVERVVLP